MESAVVELRDVRRSYGRTRALDGLTFTLRPGTCTGLIGRNGSGKTTTLRLIMGMLHPGSGTVRVFGGDPVAEAERVKLHVGYLAEDQTFPAMLRPSELFSFFADCYPTWDRAFARSLVERFRIPIDRSLSKLSKGEQRQAALVCAVAHRPKLLVLDEPGGGLDPVVRRGFLEEVIELLSREECTVLFSSHHLQEVERIADRIAILHAGKLILEDEVDRLREGSCRLLAEIDEPDAAKVKASIDGCLRAEKRNGAWLLTMLCTDIEAKQRVAARLGGRVRESQPLTLEDLFISLVG